MGIAFGNIGSPGQISDMLYRGPEQDLPDFGQSPDLPEFGMPQQPGYQQPPMGQMPQQPLPQQPLPQQQQYFQQMRQNLDGLSQAFKQIEEMQMPGGQYQGDFGGGIMGRAGK